MREFSSGKVAVSSDYGNGSDGLSLTIECPARFAVLLRNLDLWSAVNTGLNLNVLGQRSFTIERLAADDSVVSSATYPMLGYGLKGYREHIDVIRIDQVNDLSNLVDTKLRISFDGKDGFECQVILAQYECIDPDQSPYVRY